MKTHVSIPYGASLLFDGVPESFLAALGTARIVEIIGYGDERAFRDVKPSAKIEIELLPIADEENNLMKVLAVEQKALEKEREGKYELRSELTKTQKELQQLKERFGLNNE